MSVAQGELKSLPSHPLPTASPNKIGHPARPNGHCSALVSISGPSGCLLSPNRGIWTLAPAPHRGVGSHSSRETVCKSSPPIRQRHSAPSWPAQRSGSCEMGQTGQPLAGLAVVTVSGQLCGWIRPGPRLACDALLRGVCSHGLSWLPGRLGSRFGVAFMDHSWTVPHILGEASRSMVQGAERALGSSPPPWRLRDGQTSFSRSRPLDFPVLMPAVVLS